MDKKLREIFEKSDVDVFFCDKETKAITWSNRADVRKSGTKSVTEFFEGGKFPETTGIVNGIIGGRPYRYNIIETDDCFIVEILNKNIISEGMETDLLKDTLRTQMFKCF